MLTFLPYPKQSKWPGAISTCKFLTTRVCDKKQHHPPIIKKLSKFPNMLPILPEEPICSHQTSLLLNGLGQFVCVCVHVFFANPRGIPVGFWGDRNVQSSQHVFCTWTSHRHTKHHDCVVGPMQCLPDVCKFKTRVQKFRGSPQNNIVGIVGAVFRERPFPPCWTYTSGMLQPPWSDF